MYTFYNYYFKCDKIIIIIIKSVHNKLGWSRSLKDNNNIARLPHHSSNSLSGRDHNSHGPEQCMGVSNPFSRVSMVL